MQQIEFGPYRLDASNALLKRDGTALALTPKAFAVLQCLAEHSGELVTKAALFDAVWPKRVVGDAVLKVCICEIREALQDSATRPEYIETVHRRGYRFIARTSVSGNSDQRGVAAKPIDGVRSPVAGEGGGVRPARRGRTEMPHLVGRARELAELTGALNLALAGERQIVLVTGEPGIGKSTLVEAFVLQVGEQAWVARGQCVAQFGAGEPYLPVLDALNQLTAAAPETVTLVRRYAPTWLAQMPWLSADDERARLQQEIIGATGGRMLREMAEALERIAAEAPLVLVLEDLHWSDAPTLALLSAIARRRDPVRLLIVGTLRSAEVVDANHPLNSVRQELTLHGLSRELALAPLSEAHVGEYLERRFQKTLPADLARMVHKRSAGNPLFVTGIADYCANQAWLFQQAPLSAEEVARLQGAVPENVRSMIANQIERLSREEQRALEAGSVAGGSFSALAVAAALNESAGAVEDILARLVHSGRFLLYSVEPDVGEQRDLTDRRAAGRYQFIHALHRDVLYERLAQSRRSEFHASIGAWKEAAFGVRAAPIAAELARHFEEARDYQRAIRHLSLAAENAMHRYATAEAIAHLSRALELAHKLPAAEPAQTRQVQRVLLEQRGLARRVAADMAGAAADFDAMAALARSLDDIDSEILARVYHAIVLSWLDRDQSLAAAAELERLSRAARSDTSRRIAAGWAGYWNLRWNGWRDADARGMDEAIELARRSDDRWAVSMLGARCSYFQVLGGNYAAARDLARESMQAALEVGNAFEHLLAQDFYAWASLLSGDWRELPQLLRAGIDAADNNADHLAAMFLRIELARLHLEAGDFAGARRVCRQAHADASAVALPYGRLRVSVFEVRALLGLGALDAARECIAQIDAEMSRLRLFNDWILRLPLHQARAEFHLATGQPQLVDQEARHLQDWAGGPGEPTSLAIAEQLRAEAALATDRVDDARAHLVRADEIVAARSVPLAAWRVHMTDAKCRERARDTSGARERRKQAAAVLAALGNSLVDESELRSSLDRQIGSLSVRS